MGDFDEVDGRSRPGLAKLTGNGKLDPIFVPEASEIVPPVKEHMLLNSVGLGWDGGSLPTEKLIPLPGGRLIVVGLRSWEIRDSDGGVNRGLMDRVVKTGADREIPLFTQGERLFTKVIAEGEVEFRAYRGTDLEIDESLKIPSELLSIAPATGEMLWAFGVPEKVPGSGPFAAHLSPMRRLLKDGTEDASFPVNYVTSEIARRVQYGDLRTKIGGAQPRGANVYDSLDPDLFLTYFLPDPKGVTVGHSFRVPYGPFTQLASPDPEGWFTSPRFDLQTLCKKRRIVTGDPNVIREEELEGFEIPLSGPCHPVTGAPHTLNVKHLKGGGILVGGTRKFLADGTLDPEWHQARCSRTATLKGLTSLNNGNIIVYGEFDRVDDHEMSGIAQLTPEGTVVPEFRPDLDLRSVIQVEAKDDGDLIVLISRGWFDETGRRSPLLLLGSEGRFIKPLYFDGTTEEQLGRGPSRQEPVAFARQSNETMVLSVWSAEATIGNNIVGRAYLIPPEGGTPASALNLTYGNPGWRHRALVTSSDRILYSTRIFESDGTGGIRIPDLDFYVNRVVEFPDGSILFDSGSRYNRSVIRNWHPVTGEVPGFEQDPVQRPPIDTGVLDHREGVIAISSKQRRLGLPSSITRLERFGRRDPMFRVNVPSEEDAILCDVLAMENRVWVVGRFEQLNGRQCGSLAVLDNRKVEGFGEWMKACAIGRNQSNLQAHEDVDGDGFSNFEEYAAGTDPLNASAFPVVRYRKDEWRVEVNPDSRDVVREVELSDDLITWRLPVAGEVVVEKKDHQFCWKIAGNARFSRLVYNLKEE